ncbi:uncharacterized protein AC631_04920 [Debaryomyces fabryi]|uniref:Glutamate--cysteine ligase n=1 Tax=Debaryomyces fabryi TaxID=58627 RepID=A0A0V1PT51_9ASCO|nr:uncharacterized protein AC631_04920 [Debaryomyces fabryi]KRZ99321.1 hypothetical protein AC631_04920 [Debaryomyces fabryi]CUM53199.1 unnamed protein product [Debaryomyces fabryi]
MGLLSLGTPLDWHDANKFNEHVRENGIKQLINIFKQHSTTRVQDPFYWGEEVEYMLVDIDSKSRTARLAIDKDYILNDLNDPEKPESYEKSISNNISFHPEYGRYMIEATPLRPYHGDLLDDYVYVEENMIQRRKVSESELPKNIKPLTLTSFPRMGCDNFTSPPAKPIGPASQSLFLPDEIINRHVRFPTLTANIRKRRGCKVAINLPMYPDINTKLIDDSIPKNRDLFDSDKEPWLGASKPGHVYMDSMGFGMGSSCLQVTMQAQEINEARYLYDTLAPLTPIMLSLTAAAPIFKGFLVNQDVRWNVISGAVDDRTFIERDVEPYPGYDFFGGLDVADEDKKHMETLGGGRGVNGDRISNRYGDTKLRTTDGKPIQKITKSRYESINSYLSDYKYSKKTDVYFKDKYNDIYMPMNTKVYEQLMDSKLFDPIMAQHFAYLFIRDPLVIFSERIDQDNELENDHFENLQSTNWQTLRFKPPALYPKDTTPQELATKPGWRVEFRPMEIQLTDFENAAYSVFIALLSKAILKFKPDFYIPILQVDENMETAHKVDSVLKDKFWFKASCKWGLNNDEFIGYDLSWFDRFINRGNDELGVDDVYVNGYSSHAKDNVINGNSRDDAPCDYNESKYTVDEIINGGEDFPGMIKLIIKLVATELLPESSQHHCESLQLANTMLKLQNYLRLISYRASGKIPTIAHWIRHKALSSPLYKQDSKVSEDLAYDLIRDATRLSDLDFSDPELFTSYFGTSITNFLRSNSNST